MPRLDIYHDTVKRALEKDGWQITQDPYRLNIGKKRLFADLGAERLLSAEKGTCQIAVEIKSFLGPSDVTDLEKALGQYVLYQHLMELTEPNRLLYLAVSTQTFYNTFALEIGQLLLDKGTLRLFTFNIQEEVITQWIPSLQTNP